MMIGAGIMQYPAIEVAKKNGYDVVSVDGNKDAPGCKISDYFIHADISRWDLVLEKAIEFNNRTRKIGGVITIGTDFSYTVAKVAEYFNLVGVSPETALAATRKDVMRKAFKENGVPCPEFYTTDNLKDAKKILKKLEGACVIKPVDNMGARGVRFVSNEDELEIAFARAMKFSRTRKVIMEEFMEGPELSIDTIVYDGRVHQLTIADRHISGFPYFIERGHTIPSILPKEVLNDVFEVMKKGIKALGINIGASKADMKVTKDGPKIGEMTARLSGGFHSQYTDPLATGMQSMKAAIDIAMGKKLDLNDITPKYNRSACERSLYPKPGRVISINGVEEAGKSKGIAKIFINVKVGDILEPITSNMGKAGHIIAWGINRDEAINNCEKAKNLINITTEPL